MSLAMGRHGPLGDAGASGLVDRIWANTFRISWAVPGQPYSLHGVMLRLAGTFVKMSSRESGKDEAMNMLVGLSTKTAQHQNRKTPDCLSTWASQTATQIKDQPGITPW